MTVNLLVLECCKNAGLQATSTVPRTRLRRKYHSKQSTSAAQTTSTHDSIFSTAMDDL